MTLMTDMLHDPPFTRRIPRVRFIAILSWIDLIVCCSHVRMQARSRACAGTLYVLIHNARRLKPGIDFIIAKQEHHEHLYQV